MEEVQPNATIKKIIILAKIAREAHLGAQGVVIEEGEKIAAAIIAANLGHTKTIEVITSVVRRLLENALFDKYPDITKDEDRLKVIQELRLHELPIFLQAA